VTICRSCNRRFLAPRNYFDDDGNEYLTRRGAQILLGYAEPGSIDLPPVSVEGKRPRVDRQGRPVRDVFPMPAVLAFAEKRHRRLPNGFVKGSGKIIEDFSKYE
jgi:hypothetical protein